MKNGMNNELILLFKSTWCNTSHSSNRLSAKQLAQQGIEQILHAQTAAITFAFSSVFFPSSTLTVYHCVLYLSEGSVRSAGGGGLSEDKKAREQLLALNQVLARQVMEKSRMVAGTQTPPTPPSPPFPQNENLSCH